MWANAPYTHNPSVQSFGTTPDRHYTTNPALTAPQQPYTLIGCCGRPVDHSWARLSQEPGGHETITWVAEALDSAVGSFQVRHERDNSATAGPRAVVRLCEHIDVVWLAT